MTTPAGQNPFPVVSSVSAPVNTNPASSASSSLVENKADSKGDVVTSVNVSTIAPAASSTISSLVENKADSKGDSKGDTIQSASSSESAISTNDQQIFKRQLELTPEQINEWEAAVTLFEKRKNEPDYQMGMRWLDHQEKYSSSILEKLKLGKSAEDIVEDYYYFIDETCGETHTPEMFTEETQADLIEELEQGCLQDADSRDAFAKELSRNIYQMRCGKSQSELFEFNQFLESNDLSDLQGEAVFRSLSDKSKYLLLRVLQNSENDKATQEDLLNKCSKKKSLTALMKYYMHSYAKTRMAISHVASE